MATSKEYAAYVAEALAPLGAIRTRPMMGEYVLYYQDKTVGGIYDERVLVKNIPEAAEILADASLEIPYDGAKPMLLVEELENTVLMQRLMDVLFAALPAPKPRRKKKAQNAKQDSEK